ncbi:hypothetical protein KUCAC02_029425, partial [Chaenocephalus aceratus]
APSLQEVTARLIGINQLAARCEALTQRERGGILLTGSHRAGGLFLLLSIEAWMSPMERTALDEQRQIQSDGVLVPAQTDDGSSISPDAYFLPP